MTWTLFDQPASVPFFGAGLPSRPAADRPRQDPRLRWWGHLHSGRREDGLRGYVALCSGRRGAALVVADGLGHGPLAAQASTERVMYPSDRSVFSAGHHFRKHSCHDRRHTRGGPCSGAIDPVPGKLIYAGVGNIAGTARPSDGASRGLVSHNGTVGHLVRKIQPFEYPWLPSSCWCSIPMGCKPAGDGQVPGLMRRHPTVIAALFFGIFGVDAMMPRRLSWTRHPIMTLSMLTLSTNHELMTCGNSAMRRRRKCLR